MKNTTRTINKNNLVLFLIKYGGFETSDKAQDFVDELPDSAEFLMKQIVTDILADKGISDGYKTTLREYYEKIFT